MNRAVAITKEQGGSLASAIGIAQNEDGEGTAHDDGSEEAEANADALPWIQKRTSEMKKENPTLSVATCLGMATFEFHNQQWNLGL